MPLELLVLLALVLVVQGIVLIVLVCRVRAFTAQIRTLRLLQFDEPAIVDAEAIPPGEARRIRRYTVFQHGPDGAKASSYSGTDRKLAKRLFTDMACVPGGAVTCEAEGQVLWRRTA